MRILYLLTSLGVGGAEKQALAVVERMARRGHTVAVLVLMPHLAEEWPTAIRTVHLDVRKTPASVLGGLIRGRNFLREFRPDLVHSHSFHANIFARLLRFAGPPFVVLSTVHNVYEGRWWRMAAYRVTDGLGGRTVAVSEAAAERFIRLKAVPPHKCSVVLNGIDVDGFAPDCNRRARLRAEMEIAAGSADFIWLAVGRLAPAKDYPNLLRAFSVVRAQKPETQLWVAGDARETSARRFEIARERSADRRSRPLAWPAPRHACDPRRVRCIRLRLCLGGNAARSGGSNGDGETCCRNRRGRRSRAGRGCGSGSSGKRFSSVGRSDADDDAREQGSARYAGPCGARARARPVQHGRNRGHVGSAVRFVGHEP